MRSLKYIFEPKSVAVIGASTTIGSVGNAIFSNLLYSNFQGILYPVNPRYKSIMSVRSYKDVLSIPDPIDLAIICVSKEVVGIVVKQCAEKEIKGIVLITAGFKEIGEVGKKMEDEIVEVANRYNIALVGPNVLGLINTQKEISLNANFAFKLPRSGNIALISQSGAIGIAALAYAHRHNLGISKFISIGNKALIDESDVLNYLIDDDETRIITIYVEDIRNPARFLEMANKANAKKKPIIIIKTGRSVRGAIASRSHTGALSTSDVAYDLLFAKCGVIRVTKLEELFEYAKGFTSLVHPKGKRIVVISNGGGMGVIATDSAEINGLEMSTFEPETLEALKKVLPPTANIQNPVDIIGDADAERLNNALSIIKKDKNVDAIIVSILPTVETDMDIITANLCNFAKENPDISILTNLVSLEINPNFNLLLEKANIPNFDFPESDIRVLSAIIKYYEWLEQPTFAVTKFEINKNVIRNILDFIKKEKRTNLSEPESYKILEACGLKVVEGLIAKDINETISSAKKIGYPVVLKIISSEILHKVDVGGVKLNLKDENELENAFFEINENIKTKNIHSKIQGFLIQKYFTDKGIEIIAGANEIKGFGPLIMFGLGGTFVELFKDVAFRLAPLTKHDALNMIYQTKGSQILRGYRGQPAYKIDDIIDCLLRVSQLVVEFPEIQELDLNPIKVLEDGGGMIIMDAKMIIKL